MNNTLYLIVEGKGEESAAPELLRRILFTHLKHFDLQPKALNANGQANLTKKGGLEKFLELTRRRSDCGGVLILVDAEEEHVDCSVTFARNLADRTRALKLPFPACVVVAACEFESWFLVNLDSIAPKYFRADALRHYEGDAERECSAKGWLKRQMPKGVTYKETIDQVKMAVAIDIPHTIQHCRSFRRLVEATEDLIEARNRKEIITTPD